MTSNRAMARSAIARRRLRVFEYGGHPRTAEPYRYGTSRDMGMVLVYQVAGGSSSGTPGRRRMYVDHGESMRVLERRFRGNRRDVPEAGRRDAVYSPT